MNNFNKGAGYAGYEDTNIMIKNIKEFHEMFRLEYDGPPRELEQKLSVFRIRFIDEELTEYDEACVAHDKAKQLDSLVDIVYVTLGTAYAQGFDFNEAWRRVHAANMKKVRALKASDSERGSTYDVVKPPGWEPANLEDLV